jgi:hypothetical protein
VYRSSTTGWPCTNSQTPFPTHRAAIGLEEEGERYLPMTKEEAGADGTAARQRRGTAAPACTTPHLQHLSGPCPSVRPSQCQGREIAAIAQVISSLGARGTRRGRARSREEISLGEMTEARAADRLPYVASAVDAGVRRDQTATPPATRCRESEGNN